MINLIENRWLEDKSKLPLSESQKNIYFNAQNTHYHANGCFFNIQSPKTLNDKIQWTKFFDQQEDTITCTDKILVKDFVKKITGKDHYAKVLWQSNNLVSFSKNDLPKKFVLKTNNDSGTTFLVKDKDTFNFYSAFDKINNTLNSVYGTIYGEWSYQKLKPKVFVEEYINDGNNELASDYKFFCGKGEVFFCHHIYDRSSGQASEQIINAEGKQINYYLDPNFKKGSGFVKPDNWNEMVSLASQLSKHFKLVRIDLYNSNNKIYVGEITFWPYAGIYKGEDQKKISELIDLDNKTFLESVI
jgi:hypothetical protein